MPESAGLSQFSTGKRGPTAHTFSIVARDPENGDLGIAVASKFLAVGAAVPWAEAEVGAIATQSFVNTSYGPRGLALLRDGRSAGETLNRLITEDEGRSLRQVGIVDAEGRAAAHTGADCTAWAGQRLGDGLACQGNMLIGPEVLDAMVSAFAAAPGSLPERLYAALSAGEDAGGDRRGKQAAALLAMRRGAGYGGFNDVLVDIRVDDHDEPVTELRRLLDLHQLFFGITPADEKLPIDTALVVELQALLVRQGYYQDAADGTWDAETQDALQSFIGVENLEERIDIPGRTIDPPALAYLRETFGG